MVPSVYLHVASAKAPRADSSGCWLCYTPSASGRAARPLGSHWMGGPPTPLPPHYHPTSTTAGLPPLLPMAEPAAPTSAASTPQVYCVQWSGDSSRIASAGQESLAGLGPLRGVMPPQPQPYNLTPSLTSNLTPSLTPSLTLSSSLIPSLPVTTSLSSPRRVSSW